MGDDRFSHHFGVSDKGKKWLEQAAALLNLEDASDALNLGVHFAKDYSKAYVEGKTRYVFCTPEMDAHIENNPAFFAALCEEGVIEWLTPFVLGKSIIPPEENQ